LAKVLIGQQRDMSSFSERNGYKPAKKAIQRELLDDELRSSLWNAFYITYCHNKTYRGDLAFDQFSRILWVNYFKKPLDSIINTYRIMRKCIMEASWNEVFDFIEFTAGNYPEVEHQQNQHFVNRCN
jgi:hypothetical protein